MLTRLRPEAVLFDLDGTLIDSVPDITEAVAELMATEGLPRHPEEAVRAMVGHGLEKLVERAFAAHQQPREGEALHAMIRRMRGIYPNHLVGKTRLMPGAAAVLEDLRGTPLAVVTNKPEEPTKTILKHFGLEDRFRLILGDRGPGALPKKPAPEMLLFAAEALGVAPGAAVMVGDSGADVESGRAAGMRVVAVRGGYNHAPLESYGPDVVIDSLHGLIEVLVP